MTETVVTEVTEATETAGTPQGFLRARPDEERVPHRLSDWPSWYAPHTVLRTYPALLVDSPAYHDEQAARMKACRKRHDWTNSHSHSQSLPHKGEVVMGNQ